MKIKNKEIKVHEVKCMNLKDKIKEHKLKNMN